MLTGDVRPSTLAGVKRLAAQFRKERGLKHSSALDLAARAAHCLNYRHAQRTLPQRGSSPSRLYVLLTVYWIDRKGWPQGRETLEVSLSKPILDLCGKADLKRLRGFGAMRMVAADHFVSDAVAQGQADARERICTAVRALRFVEHTGLRPSRDYRKAYAGVIADTKLPDADHATDWTDPATGQFIVIDEPYSGVPDEAKRAAWANCHGWRVAKSTWPGMYNPHHCDLYVATDDRVGYDVDALVATIDTLPPPLEAKDWQGASAPSLDVFVSPAAKTPQDRRRARARGTIMPVPNATTIPYRMMLGSAERRPAGAPGVEAHVAMGRMIKAALRSSERPYGVYQRMNALRSTLEDWMALEIGRGQLDGPEFFDVYYHEDDEDPALAEASRSRAGLVGVLESLRVKLARAYPDCAPLRRELHKIDMSIAILRKSAKAVGSFDSGSKSFGGGGASSDY